MCPRITHSHPASSEAERQREPPTPLGPDPMDAERVLWALGKPRPADQISPLLSEPNQLLTRFAPCLCLSEQLKRSARRAPSSALHLYPTGGHGFGLCQAATANHECCEWPLAAQRFMQEPAASSEGPPRARQAASERRGAALRTREEGARDAGEKAVPLMLRHQILVTSPARLTVQERDFAPSWPATPCDGVYDGTGSLRCHAGRDRIPLPSGGGGGAAATAAAAASPAAATSPAAAMADAA